MKQKIENFLYNKKVIFIYFFIILLSYCYLGTSPVLEYSINILTSLLCAILIFFYLLNRNISKICLFVIIYVGGAFISSILGEHSSIILFFKNYCRIVATAFYLDYGIKHYCKNTIHSFYLVYYILIFINFLTLIIWPNGLYTSIRHTNNWFFGYDNGHILWYIPAIMLMFINKKIFNRKLNAFDWILLLIITYGVFYCFSATSVVGYCILIIYLLCKKLIDKFSFFNSITYFITYLISFIGFVILRIQNIFSVIIVNILKKDLTFTTRTEMWDSFMKLIKEHPLLGFGTEPHEYLAYKFGAPNYSSAHNTILDVLYRYGIIGIITFFSMLIFAIKELFKNRKNTLSKFLSIVLFSLLIMMNFESRQSQIGLYIVLISCSNISYLLQHIENSNS